MNINEPGEPIIETARSFSVKIEYRQNTSWQGTIKWLDGKQTRHFRSCLEMMMLIEDALTSDKAEGKRIEFHSWDDNDDGKLLDMEISDIEISRRKVYREFSCKDYK